MQLVDPVHQLQIRLRNRTRHVAKLHNYSGDSYMFPKSAALIVLSSIFPMCSALQTFAGVSASNPTNLMSDAQKRCDKLSELDLSQIPEAPTQIIEAKFSSAVGNSVGYCEVSGYVAPAVGFLLRLPDQWNRKFMELGCGGYCGSTGYIDSCNALVSRGYACLVFDNGHRSTSADAKWAYNNLSAEIDHAYRGPHVTALAGKAIVENFYGRTPERSYFLGGSTGGRLALMEAQRFPWDFDGIIAGVPSLGVPALHMSLLWGNRAITGQDNEALLNQDNLNALHRAVLKRCDLNDGISDGLIGDPRDCFFDPSELLCDGRATKDCLSAKQVDAVRKLYLGPSTSKGVQIYPPGAMKGSELVWVDWFKGRPGFIDMYKFVGEEFRYSAFYPDPGPTWSPEQFDFDRDYKRLGVSEALYSATNPDLRKFQDAGGKLLAYAGWGDAAGMALPVVDYYETVERTMGGRVPTQHFFRLFVVPGMSHGADKNWAFVTAWLDYLEAWVEGGAAPDRVIVYSVRVRDLNLDTPHGNSELARRMTFPLEPSFIDFSRPVYPYPLVSKYSGRGDPKNAESFKAVQRSRRPN